MVVKSHRHLDQPLAKFLVVRRRRTPDVLEDLMSVKEARAVEETYSASQFVVSHASFLHTSHLIEDGSLAPLRPKSLRALRCSELRLYS